MSFLKGCVIVITGDFGEEITQTKVKSWIKFNGGTFSADVNEDVTHLVCSREEWLKKGKCTYIRHETIVTTLYG
jgi:NAD-dependent DNA ligase